MAQVTKQYVLLAKSFINGAIVQQGSAVNITHDSSAPPHPRDFKAA